MITREGNYKCDHCNDDNGEFNATGNHPICEENAVLRKGIVLLDAALEIAVETIRAWHGMRFGGQDEKVVWQAYQSSPEMKKINAALTGSGAEEAGKLLEAARGLVEYRKSSGPINFQLEKADTFIKRMENALEVLGGGGDRKLKP